VHKTDVWGCTCYCFKAESYQRAEVTAEIRKWDTEAGEIAGVERPFLRASSDGDDAAEKGGVLEERKEVSDEAEAGVVV
jgi:hypothetical protein